MIVQNVSTAGTTDISFTLNKDELAQGGGGAQAGAERDRRGRTDRHEDGIAKLSIVGIGMRSHSGVAAKLFEALSNGGDQYSDDLDQRNQNGGDH